MSLISIFRLSSVWIVINFYLQVDLSVWFWFSGWPQCEWSREADRSKTGSFPLPGTSLICFHASYILCLHASCLLSDIYRKCRVMFGLIKYAVWGKKPWNMFLMFQTIWLHLLMIMQPHHECYDNEQSTPSTTTGSQGRRKTTWCWITETRWSLPSVTFKRWISKF